MSILAWPLKNSIGTKIFGAFLAMSLVTAALGGYGLYVLSSAGNIVSETYDHPLMAINYARAANLDFVQMDEEEVRSNTISDQAKPELNSKIELFTTNFFDDLDVADQRALGKDEHEIIKQLRSLVKKWGEVRAAHGDLASLQAITDDVNQKFDTLTELTADHSFVERHKSVLLLNYFKYTSIAALVAALLMSALITVFLSRRIVRPLSAAAVIADQIAEGELQTLIPAGDSDETGALLRSMTVMQDNIRIMMEREKTQRESAQNRLIDALESSHEGMVLIDADGKIVIANSQLAEFFPTVKPAGLIGKDFIEAFGPLHPKLIERMNSEFRLDDQRWIRISVSTTQDNGFFLFLSDFTEFKEREHRYREAKQAAEASNIAKSQFLANMSHELRTPLNAIIGFSEIITGQIFGVIENKRYVGYANDVLQSGKHLLDVINSVLDLAKSQAGKLELRKEIVELDTILQRCEVMVRPQAEKAQLALSIAKPDPTILINGDSSKLRQIFLNLLSNAIKFTPPGGNISLALASTTPNSVDINITDTGIGIAPDDIPIALAPFGQVDSRLSRSYEGTGLGLPLTKALVELHGGTLEILSALGTGTTVTVKLPLAMAKAENLELQDQTSHA